MKVSICEDMDMEHDWIEFDTAKSERGYEIDIEACSRCNKIRLFLPDGMKL